MKKWDNQKTENLFKAILTLKSLKETKKFFRDLLTEQEIIEFGKRWQAAQMLNRGVPYSEIEKVTGLSSTTIARVSRWLNKGLGGYKLILKRLNLHHSNPSSFGKGLR
jgi:TrpR-related protein YerC/YecD